MIILPSFIEVFHQFIYYLFLEGRFVQCPSDIRFQAVPSCERLICGVVQEEVLFGVPLSYHWGPCGPSASAGEDVKIPGIQLSMACRILQIYSA